MILAADCEIPILSRYLLTADILSAAVSCVVGVFCSCIGDVWRREVVERIRRSSFGVQLETMFVLARVEGLSYPVLFLFYHVNTAANDTEWAECIEISSCQGLLKASINSVSGSCFHEIKVVTCLFNRDAKKVNGQASEYF